MGVYQHWSDVRVRVTGFRMEEVVNECIRSSIVLQDIEKTDSRTMVFYTPAANLHVVEKIVQQYQCGMEVASLPRKDKLWNGLKQRWGMAVGLVLFLLTLSLLSKMIWSVDIHGASPPLEHRLQNELRDMGVKPGGFQFLVPDANRIQTMLMENVEGASWIGLQQNGTTFQFDVAEQSLPDKTENPDPRHLVASKTAVIERIFAEKGKPVVRENELVHQGDLLISGLIGEEEHTETVAASGEVWGETWYKVTVKLPEERLQETLTGESAKKYRLRVFNFHLPVWGFQADEQFSNHVLNEKEHRPSAGEWRFPVSLKIEEYQERTKTKQDGTDILEQTKQAADEKMNHHLPADAKIMSEKILHEASRNGKVKLVIHYKVLEDIKSEEPIIQGE
ncbi:sporulation protein YqfD [Salibacterium sp. K-3]